MLYQQFFVVSQLEPSEDGALDNPLMCHCLYLGSSITEEKVESHDCLIMAIGSGTKQYFATLCICAFNSIFKIYYLSMFRLPLVLFAFAILYESQYLDLWYFCLIIMYEL